MSKKYKSVIGMLLGIQTELDEENEKLQAGILAIANEIDRCNAGAEFLSYKSIAEKLRELVKQ